MTIIRIATRKSPLALWQAEHVATRLGEVHPALQVELITMTTQGDRILDAPLAKVGGKGLFVKELEQGSGAETGTPARRNRNFLNPTFLYAAPAARLRARW